MTIDVPEIYLIKYYYICIVNLIFILYCDLLYIIFVLWKIKGVHVYRLNNSQVEYMLGGPGRSSSQLKIRELAMKQRKEEKNKKKKWGPKPYWRGWGFQEHKLLKSKASRFITVTKQSIIEKKAKPTCIRCVTVNRFVVIINRSNARVVTYSHDKL